MNLLPYTINSIDVHINVFYTFTLVFKYFNTFILLLIGSRLLSICAEPCSGLRHRLSVRGHHHDFRHEQNDSRTDDRPHCGQRQECHRGQKERSGDQKRRHPPTDAGQQGKWCVRNRAGRYIDTKNIIIFFLKNFWV